VSNKKPICIDIDNTIAQTDFVIRKLICGFTNGQVNLEHRHIIRFDYHQCVDLNGHGIDEETWREVHSHKFSTPATIDTLQPISGAVAALEALSHRFDIFFVTSRQERIRAATEQWLHHHFKCSYNLDFVPHRKKHLIGMKFFAVVEDDLDQALLFLGFRTDSDFYSSGRCEQIGEPTAEHCFLLSYPWNDHQVLIDGPIKLPLYIEKSWSLITAKLLDLK